MNKHTKRWQAAFCLLSFAILLPLSQVHAEKDGAKDKMSISTGKKISLEYTLTVDGEQLESNKEKDPLVYTHGEQQIIPGLESELNGLSIGESKQVTVKPEEGYGVINDQAYVEVKLEQIPEEARKVGANLMTKAQDGSPLRARVKELKDEIVVLDFNHPLAGKTLTFDVKVLKIEEAAEAASEGNEP